MNRGEIGQGIKDSKEKQVRLRSKQIIVYIARSGRASQLRGANLPGLRNNPGPHGSLLIMIIAPTPPVLEGNATFLGHGTQPTVVQVARPMVVMVSIVLRNSQMMPPISPSQQISRLQCQQEERIPGKPQMIPLPDFHQRRPLRRLLLEACLRILQQLIMLKSEQMPRHTLHREIGTATIPRLMLLVLENHEQSRLHQFPVEEIGNR